MNTKLSMICAVALILSAASAFAGEGKDGKPIQSQAISWDEFRARCQNPKDFDKQVAPENIQISCTNLETEFVAEQPGTFPMMSSRRVMTAVYSNKWHVGGVEAKELPMQQKGGSCLRFKEVERMLTIERPVSCAEILGIKGGVDDYCSAALDQSKGQHPKMIATRDTGKLIDSCAGISVTSVGNGKEGGKGTQL